MKYIILTAIAAMHLSPPAIAGPIHEAALNGDIEEINWMLDEGTDVNEISSEGLTPLHYAASAGNSDVIELLIKRGANLNSPDKRGKGGTPLDWADWKKQPDSIDTLEAHDAKRSYGEGSKNINDKASSLKITNIENGKIIVEFYLGTLQTADSINGPWEDVDEPSPVTWDVDQSSKFARLKFSGEDKSGGDKSKSP